MWINPTLTKLQSPAALGNLKSKTLFSKRFLEGYILELRVQTEEGDQNDSFLMFFCFKERGCCTLYIL